MIYITTSRKPINNSRIFAKEFGSIIGAIYITRGKSSLSDMVSNARYNGAEKLYVITDYAGNPNQLIEISVGPKNWEISSTFNLKVYKLRKNFTNQENLRIKDVIFDPNSKPLMHIVRANGLEYNENSEYKIIEKNGVCSLYHLGKEIGPAFKLEYSVAE